MATTRASSGSKKETTKTESRIKNQELIEKAIKSVKADKVEAVISSERSERWNLDEKQIKIATASPRNDKKVGFSVPVFSLAGKEAGTLDLPKSIFGAEVNKALLSQALRVYMNNLKGHHSNTKTRGEVEGSTRKIYRQKGTGRARHGGIRAPIFVGGGIALGPKSRQVILDLPKKMKKAALVSALSQKLLDKDIFAISGLEKATGKTSEIMKFVTSNKLSSDVTSKAKNILVIGDKLMENVERATRNIQGISFLSADQLNAFEVTKAQSLIFTKGAVETLEKRILKEKGEK